jgi:hypothetical protein
MDDPECLLACNGDKHLGGLRAAGATEVGCVMMSFFCKASVASTADSTDRLTAWGRPMDVARCPNARRGVTGAQNTIERWRSERGGELVFGFRSFKIWAQESPIYRGVGWPRRRRGVESNPFSNSKFMLCSVVIWWRFHEQHMMGNFLSVSTLEPQEKGDVGHEWLLGRDLA